MSLTRAGVTTKCTGSAASGSSTTCSLAPQPRSLVAGPALRLRRQADAGGVDQAHRVARGSAQARMGLREQRLEQPAEYVGGPLRVGIGERGALGRRRTEMIEPRLLARQRRLHLAQARSTRQLRMEQRDELALAAQLAHAPVRAVLVHKRFEAVHGMNCRRPCSSVLWWRMVLIPFRVRASRQALESQKNQRHAPCPPNPTGQPWACPEDPTINELRSKLLDGWPGQARPSTKWAPSRFR